MQLVIDLRPDSTPDDAIANFEVTFNGFANGQMVDLEVMLVTRSTNAPNKFDDVKQLGLIRGTLAPTNQSSDDLTLIPEYNAISAQAMTEPAVHIIFPGGELSSMTTGPLEVAFKLPEKLGPSMGDYWLVQLRTSSPAAHSEVREITLLDRSLPAGNKGFATYSWHHHNSVTLYHDASRDEKGTTGAWADIETAISDARHFVFLSDWAFHPMVRLRRDTPATLESTIGYKLVKKARENASVLIAVLSWDHTDVEGVKDKVNDSAGDDLALINSTVFMTPEIVRPGNLLWKTGNRSGLSSKFKWSHHQKLVLVDCPVPGDDRRRDLKAFIGGLDIAHGRFDWSDHLILGDSPGAAVFHTPVEWRNQVWDDWRGEFSESNIIPRFRAPRQPWHDVHAQVIGPAAWDMAREFVGRWTGKDNNRRGDGTDEQKELVLRRFLMLFDKSRFVQQWESRLQDGNAKWAAQVYRSIHKEMWGLPSDSVVENINNDKQFWQGIGLKPATDTKRIQTPTRHGCKNGPAEFEWTVSTSSESSIHLAYLKAISLAEKFIYIETQYFISSGSKWGRDSITNKVAETLVDRIINHAKAEREFHVYIVLPMYPDSGPPTGYGSMAQRKYQWSTIRWMIATLHNEPVIKEKWRNFLSFYFLAQWHNQGILTTSGSRRERCFKNRRYMIYVHSKLMIVDDHYLILGSANLNERGLNGGRDTEICVGLWPGDSVAEANVIENIRSFRKDIWTEHLKPRIPLAIDNPESKQCVQEVRIATENNYVAFRNGTKTSDHGHLAMWPLTVSSAGVHFQTVSSAPEGEDFIPDGLFNAGSERDAFPWMFQMAGMQWLDDTELAE